MLTRMNGTQKARWKMVGAKYTRGEIYPWFVTISFIKNGLTEATSKLELHNGQSHINNHEHYNLKKKTCYGRCPIEVFLSHFFIVSIQLRFVLYL